MPFQLRVACLTIFIRCKVSSGSISMKNRFVSVRKHVLKTELCPAKLKEIFAVD